MAGLIDAGVYSRATVYNRLKECHDAGFEPGLVVFSRGTPDGWMARERGLVEEIKATQAKSGEDLPRWLRRMYGPDPTYLPEFLSEQPE